MIRFIMARLRKWSADPDPARKLNYSAQQYDAHVIRTAESAEEYNEGETQ